MSWTTFLTLVTERPDESLKIDEYFCPYCESEDVSTKCNGMTCVGGGGDANHVWTSVDCHNCGKQSTHEHIDYNTWYTEGFRNNGVRKIVRGIPSCFESYIYTCSHCGGDVTRNYLELDSDKPVECLHKKPNVNGSWENQYRIVFKCESCKENITSDIEQWYKGCESKPKPRKPSDGKLRKGWVIQEEIGIVIINPAPMIKTTGPPELLEAMDLAIQRGEL